MSRIETLTPEQQALIPVRRAEWYRVKTCTDPADRPAAESALTSMYVSIGQERPRFLWVDSPVTACLAIHVLRNAKDGDSLGASLGALLWDSLWASLWDSLWDSLGALLWALLSASLRESLWDSLWNSLGASLWASLPASLRASLGECWHWGQHDLAWVAFYQFCREVGVAYEPKFQSLLDLHTSLCKSCGWVWSYKGFCVVSERPSVVAVDERERLHRVDGPAMAFRDGCALWAVHGVRVPQRVIEAPETITAEEIVREPNAEVRRVMLDRFGPARYIEAIGAKVVDRDAEFGTLYRAALQDDEPLVMVKVTNSTPEADGTFKDYMLRVPPAIQTAREAVAWTFNRAPTNYAPSIQT